MDDSKQKYEDYLKNLRIWVYAVPDEKVTCENGHEIMSFQSITYVGEDIIPLDFTKHTAQFMLADRLPSMCGICGKPYVQYDSFNAKYGSVRFFMNGKYRKRRYEIL